MSYENKLQINTGDNAPVGELGRKMAEYGNCRVIKKSFWLKNGLTLQDKANFELYQQSCNIPSLKEMNTIICYENSTPTWLRNKIIDTIFEWYQDKITRPECLGELLEPIKQEYIDCDSCDDISTGDLTSPYMKEREEIYNASR